ncbi:hypothetical protein K443DRAFT_128621 [Laccaria amethystina LaAM-08-1]|uniref:Uncharacterized protein n=1 Tax=Laccaria amethystina LaAM-08-1 TaxID=1095629 RepID=A0A0C9YD02_9AGAR|nr:hypothetical protein K443DRAFT_128621 [Laccaria amethystina LaAM-08-1]
MSSRRVNDLLHTLRGEQFRHQQNLQRSRTHLSPLATNNTPTLPIGLANAEYSLFPSEPPQSKASATPQGASTCSGPGPPKSWTLTTKQDVYETPVWRAQALALLLSHIDTHTLSSPVPPLTLLCLLFIVSTSTGSDLRTNIVPYIPQHLRREFIQYTAVHSPLPASKLYPMFDPDGHADGEIIIIGPHANLRDDYFIRNNRGVPHRLQQAQSELEETDEELDWDADQPMIKDLQTLVLVSTHLATSTMFTLPPTITHLALINLSSSVSLHRLPNTCPLLVFLDLSYNHWLGADSKDALRILGRVEWNRFHRLRVLAFRGWDPPIEIFEKLNKGRWDDLEVVL